MSDQKPKAVPAKDKDLNDLLDSALEDFDKLNTSSASTDVKPKTDGDAAEGGAELWNEEFIMQQAKLFEDRMSSEPSADLNSTLQKMAVAAAMAIQGVDEGAVPQETQFTDSLADALKALKEGSGALQEPVAPEGLSGMFAGLQFDEEGGENPFLPVMQGMMQSLLSAEVLLPSLKELLEKYPTWLAENNDKISDSDKERYSKQQDLFKVICAELEKETPNDSADVKNERFKIVLKNMQKLHDYGQPPTELVGDPTGEGIPQFDPSALNDPSQCSLM